MFPLSRVVRARVSAVTAVVLTAASVAVPLLDRGRAPGGVAIAETATSSGYVDHHHGVCLQHSAAAWSPAPGTSLPTGSLIREVDAAPLVVHRATRPFRSLHQIRAPPLV